MVVVHSWVEVLFVLMFSAFEGLHFDIQFVCIQWKLLKEKEGHPGINTSSCIYL